MTTENENATPKPQSALVRVVEDHSPMAYIWDTARFEHAFRIAKAMSFATLIPDHLRKNKAGELDQRQVEANCFRVVNQAFIWGVNPWSIVDETFVVGGKLCYQGKVVAALVNAKCQLNERLTKTYSGKEGEDTFTITIAGTFKGASQPSVTTMSVGYAKTDNPLWRKNPRLKLWYSGILQWAREFAPELVMGIVTEDDVERVDLWKTEAPLSGGGKPATGPIRTEKPTFTTPSPSQAEADVADQAAQETVNAERKAKRAKAKVVMTEEQAEAKRQGDEADKEIEEALKQQAAEREEASKHDVTEPEFPWDEEGK